MSLPGDSSPEAVAIRVVEIREQYRKPSKRPISRGAFISMLGDKGSDIQEYDLIRVEAGTRELKPSEARAIAALDRAGRGVEYLLAGIESHVDSPTKSDHAINGLRTEAARLKTRWHQASPKERMRLDRAFTAALDNALDVASDPKARTRVRDAIREAVLMEVRVKSVQKAATRTRRGGSEH